MEISAKSVQLRSACQAVALRILETIKSCFINVNINKNFKLAFDGWRQSGGIDRLPAFR
jgi:hypothetical protein